MSFSDISNFGLGVGSAIRDGATESAASVRRVVRIMMLGVLSRATNTFPTEEEFCPVTLEEGLLAATEFFDDPLLGGDAQGIDAPTEQDASAIDDFEEVSTIIEPTGFLPFDPERVVEGGKRDLHLAIYHIVMHLTALNHPVVRNIEFLTRLNEIISAWYFTSPEETCLRWSEVSMLLSQYQVINFSDPDDDVLVLLRRTY
jgi:hypothetical protein